MRRVLTVLALGAVLYIGYQWWNALQPDTAAQLAPAAVPRPSTTLSGSMPAPPPPQTSQEYFTVAVRIPVSPHAAALNDINSLIEQGNDAEAEARLAALPADALADPAVKTALKNAHRLDMRPM